MMQDPIGRQSSSYAPPPVTQPDGVTLPEVARHYVNGVIVEFVEKCLAGKIKGPLLLQFHNLPQVDLRQSIYRLFQRKTGRTAICETACHGGLHQVRIDLKGGREGIEMTYLGLKRSEPPPMSEL